MDAEAHGEGETLLRHEKALLDLSKRQSLNVTQIYREIVSGETIAARPMMQQLLSEVEQGSWDGVLVMEIERLARGDSIDQGIVAQAFKYTNTKIITPSKVFDPSNEFDEEYFEFGLFMSRREYKTINRRIQRGRIASVKEGKYISSVAPYGYDRVKIKNDKGYTLDINPDQADVVRMIYDWYTVGELRPDNTHDRLGASRIAMKLNNLGIKPMIRDSWSKSSVTDILKNPVYLGKIRWSYRKEKKYLKNGEIKVSRPNDNDYILVDGLHKPIIDLDTYNIAQQIIAKRGQPPVPGSGILKNPLSGILYCGKCGALMTRLAKTSKTPYDAIKCPNIYCDNISAPLYVVEDVIIEALRNWLKDFKVKWNHEKVNIPYAQAIESKKSDIKQAQISLDKLSEQHERIYTFLEQGLYSSDIFAARNKKINAEAEELRTTIQFLEDGLKILEVQSNRNNTFIPMAENILESYYDIDTAAGRNEVLKEIVDKIEYIKIEPNKKGNRDNTNFTIELFPNVVKF
jgi:DNA invertase Pin-like site-specific DNA recombinase